MTDGGGLGVLLCLYYAIAECVALPRLKVGRDERLFPCSPQALFLEGVKRKHTWIQTCIRTHKS